MKSLKQLYASIKRQINIFLERPYIDSNGRYHTNGNLSAIIQREIKLESSNGTELQSCGSRLLKAIGNWQEQTRKPW